MQKNIVLEPSKIKKALHRHFKSHISFTINMNESKFNMYQHGTLFVSGFTALKIKTRHCHFSSTHLTPVSTVDIKVICLGA